MKKHFKIFIFITIMLGLLSAEFFRWHTYPKQDLEKIKQWDTKDIPLVLTSLLIESDYIQFIVERKERNFKPKSIDFAIQVYEKGKPMLRPHKGENIVKMRNIPYYPFNFMGNPPAISIGDFKNRDYYTLHERPKPENVKIWITRYVDEKGVEVKIQSAILASLGLDENLEELTIEKLNKK